MDALERLVAHDEIRMLASRYAVAVDTRDLDSLVALFVPDVRVGGDAAGHDALRASFAGSLAAIGVSILQVGTHAIDVVDPDHATGVQYTAGQVEDGGRWIHQSIVYRDTYERRDGRWLFVRRVHELFHGVEAWRNPLDQEPADWPRHPDGRGSAPASFPTWEAFWRGRDARA
jgi:ketosteroid isomerase-like protein